MKYFIGVSDFRSQYPVLFILNKLNFVYPNKKSSWSRNLLLKESLSGL